VSDHYKGVLADLFALVREETFDPIERLYGLRCKEETPLEASENWGIAWVERGDDERDLYFSLGLDHAAYDEDWDPVGCEAVLEVWLSIGVGKRRIAAARERVAVALKECGLATTHEYPNAEPLSANKVLHEVPTESGGLLDYVFLAVRSAPFDPRSAPSVADWLGHLEAMSPALARLKDAMNVALGAIFGEAPSPSRAVVQGWLGEVFAWRSPALDLGELDFSVHWQANHDLRSEDGRPVEVKALTGADGVLHLSAAEVALALDDPRCALVLVQVDSTIVSRAYELVRDADHETPGDSRTFGEWLPAMRRLSQATGVAVRALAGHADAWRGIFRELQDEGLLNGPFVDPLRWFEPVRAEIVRRDVGLNMPARTFGGAWRK
jgi:hypothetical protein